MTLKIFDESILSSMTYSDMCLARSSRADSRRTAIGIRNLANEQMAREYGPLKNSTFNPTHKSSQNHEMRGSKSRPTLTLHDAIYEAK
jgi:hypothetical protein